MDPAVILSAGVTGVFGVVIAAQNRGTKRSLRTNHGKRAGEHIEQMAVDAAEAALEARRVRVELGEYKLLQGVANNERLAWERAHQTADESNFREIRTLLAASTPPATVVVTPVPVVQPPQD